MNWQFFSRLMIRLLYGGSALLLYVVLDKGLVSMLEWYIDLETVTALVSLLSFSGACLLMAFVYEHEDLRFVEIVIALMILGLFALWLSVSLHIQHIELSEKAGPSKSGLLRTCKHLRLQDICCIVFFESFIFHPSSRSCPMFVSPLNSGTASFVPTVGQAVYVAKLTVSGPNHDQVSCAPVFKRVLCVGRRVVIFDDGSDESLQHCYPNSKAGHQACAAWCERIAQHQQAFHWPIPKPK